MSESRPVYIPCASGNNAFADCLVMQRGDLIRLAGPSQLDFLDFTPIAARNLALKILELLGDDELPKFPQNDVHPLRRARKLGGYTGTLVAEYQTTTGECRVVMEYDAPVQGVMEILRADEVYILHQPPRPFESGDAIVDAVRERLLNRSLAGQLKYGQKMTRDDLRLSDWIRHAQEECLDQAVYLERLGREVKMNEDDGK